MLLFSLVSFATYAQSSLVGKPAPSFTLEDQFDKKENVKFSGKQPTILLFSDRNEQGAKQAEQWGNELVSEYGKDIRVVVIAVPGQGAKLVKNKVQNGFKKSDPILFDWDNEVASQYGYTEKVCMVVYVNKQGIVEAIEKGAYSDTKYNKLTEKLDDEIEF
jgi:peroxiredoxin